MEHRLTSFSSTLRSAGPLNDNTVGLSLGELHQNLQKDREIGKQKEKDSYTETQTRVNISDNYQLYKNRLWKLITFGTDLSIESASTIPDNERSTVQSLDTVSQTTEPKTSIPECQST